MGDIDIGPRRCVIYAGEVAAVASLSQQQGGEAYLDCLGLVHTAGHRGDTAALEIDYDYCVAVGSNHVDLRDDTERFG
jgi:hypothetical protein